MPIHFIIGGARSGKSAHAAKLAEASGLPVSTIVTAEALDDEMALRIRRHKNDRPASWQTVEAPLHLADALLNTAARDKCVIVDCLTLWLSNLMGTVEITDQTLEMPPHDEYRRLLEALPDLPGSILLVANEVGLGLVPETPLGRLFRDEAGRLNQRIAACCDRVTFVAAGLPLTLKDG